ncbi:MAG TPA: polyketide cyclase/dehydrase, partial [Janthinobacterium sp.]|nr:polyketide cyclase/dehydrase [Janthinobacterium sp.]
MWTHEESIETSAGAERIWGLFEDVARWKDWNAGIERIELHGPFVVGTTFTMQPPGQETFTSTLVEVEPGRSFTDKTVVDETVVLVSHKLEPLPSGRTRITYATS